MGRFRVRVKQPEEARAKTVEELNTHAAAMAVLREFYSDFKRQGFRCEAKAKENRKLWFFRGEEVATLELQYTVLQEDIERRVRTKGNP
jgi:hypothetical protein